MSRQSRQRGGGQAILQVNVNIVKKTAPAVLGLTCLAAVLLLPVQGWGGERAGKGDARTLLEQARQ